MKGQSITFIFLALTFLASCEMIDELTGSRNSTDDLTDSSGDTDNDFIEQDGFLDFTTASNKKPTVRETTSSPPIQAATTGKSATTVKDETCKPGKWGKKCNRRCPAVCKSQCDKNTSTCDSCIDGLWSPSCYLDCPENCLGGCHQSTGDCVGCQRGYLGDKCDQTCIDHKHCKVCENSTGTCIECESGYFGRFCENECNADCHYGCSRLNGACHKCTQGSYGFHCHLRCSRMCIDGCEQSIGKCIVIYPPHTIYWLVEHYVVIAVPCAAFVILIVVIAAVSCCKRKKSYLAKNGSLNGVVNPMFNEPIYAYAVSNVGTDSTSVSELSNSPVPRVKENTYKQGLELPAVPHGEHMYAELDHDDINVYLQPIP